MLKLAIVTTHPVQYYAPFFQLLSSRGKVDLKVFYTWPQAIEGFDDPDFGKKVSWDIPLLDGYKWHLSNNISANPGSKTWRGIDCPQLINEISDYQPDAVMVIGWNFKSHFRVMRHFKGKTQVWFTGDSTLLDEQPGIKRIIRRLLLKFVYSYVDKAFYVGSNNKAYFQAHGLKENQLIFFPHAIDNNRFEGKGGNHEKQAHVWKKELGIPEGSVTLLFAGKLEPKKDPLLLVQSVIEINKSTPARRSRSSTKLLAKIEGVGGNQRINLIFVGDGPLASAIHPLTKQHSWLHHIPFQNQSIMPVVYRLGDVFVLPSKGPGETWGLAINEAMASKRPVIASDRVGCAADLIQSGLNGEIFSSGNKESLIQGIRKIIDGDMHKFGEEALKIVREWSYQKKCESIEQFS